MGIDAALVQKSAQTLVDTINRHVDPVSAPVARLHSRNHSLYGNIPESNQALADRLSAVLDNRVGFLIHLGSGIFAPYGADIHVADLVHETSHLGQYLIRQVSTTQFVMDNNLAMIDCFSNITPLLSIATGVFKFLRAHQLIHQARETVGALGSLYTPDVRTSIIKSVAYQLVLHFQDGINKGYPQCTRVRSNIIPGRKCGDVWLQILIVQSLDSLKAINKSTTTHADNFADNWFKHIEEQFHAVGDLLMPKNNLPVYTKAYTKEELEVVLEVRRLLFTTQVQPTARAASTPRNVGAISRYLQSVLDELLPNREGNATSSFWLLMGYSKKGIDDLRELHIRLISVISYTSRKNQRHSIPDRIKNMIDSLVLDFIIQKAQNRQFEYHRGLHRVLVRHLNAITRIDIEDQADGSYLVKYRDSSNALSENDALRKEIEAKNETIRTGEIVINGVVNNMERLEKKIDTKKSRDSSLRNTPVAEPVVETQLFLSPRITSPRNKGGRATSSRAGGSNQTEEGTPLLSLSPAEDSKGSPTSEGYSIRSSREGSAHQSGVNTSLKLSP